MTNGRTATKTIHAQRERMESMPADLVERLWTRTDTDIRARIQAAIMQMASTLNRASDWDQRWTVDDLGYMPIERLMDQIMDTIATLTAERDGLREQHVAIDAAKQERGQH